MSGMQFGVAQRTDVKKTCGKKELDSVLKI